MVNVMIVEDQKLVRSILESYIKKEGAMSCCPPYPGRTGRRTYATPAGSI